MGIIQHLETMIDIYIGIILVAIFGVIKSERVPPEELYGNRYNDQMKNCIQNIQEPRPNRATCDLSENELAVDYICRYRVKRQRKNGLVRPLLRRCYCCGYFYSYVEYGRICTAYCNSEIGEERKIGLEPLITLPFNWGDVCPEAVYDYNSNEVDLDGEECPGGIEYDEVTDTQDPVPSFVSKPTKPHERLRTPTTAKTIPTRRPSKRTSVKTTTRVPLTQTTSVKSIRSTSQLPRTQSPTSSEISKIKRTTFHPLQEIVALKKVITLKEADAVTQGTEATVTWSSR